MPMTRDYPEFTGFDWDDGNRDKNLKRRVLASECEQVFFNQPLMILDDPKHTVAEERCAAFGQTDQGRPLVVVYTQRAGLLRVISARDMSRKERQFYEHAAKD
ncbi:MAG: BrnT family toxin [Chlamydiota bacterium]